ncbi:hypothetical protein KUV39_08740 [Phaeobacter italicus]|uniref:hypothetical protein n=1 Tax=Phaeobacter italicus TaxID=481446 RepID=UPI001C95E23E|nr:hypothetical protein [Phaeobacter italicus]MBY5976732.1 hypothetical protein [Phaeobacter italicus]
MRVIWGCAAALMIAACTSSAGFVQSDMTDRDKMVHDQTLKLRLKNHAAAQFIGEPKLAVNPKGGRLICGTVNAPNGFGGYNGFQPYAIVYVPHIKNFSPILTLGPLAGIDCRGAGLHPSLPS